MEAADEAFLAAEVDRSLEPDARVDLPDQRSGDPDVADAPADERCRERDDVGADAAAEGDEQAFAVEPLRERLRADGLYQLHRLALLARVQDQRRDGPGPGERGADGVAVHPLDGRRGDE